MVKTKRVPQTWIELAVANAGMRLGLRGMSWALSWAIVGAATGNDPSAEEVAAWWRENPRTAYREQAAFRKAFPDLDTPARIFAHRDAKALVNEFVASIPKGGALKQIRALEEATIRIGYMPADL
jgi:hypothetical protein